MAQPTKFSSKKAPVKTAAKATPAKTQNAKRETQHATPGLHYNKQDLHDDYTQTFNVFMKMLAIGILGALAYFFVMIVYLGAFGHTKTDDYIREFGTRIQYDYKGLRMPEYDDPSLLNKPADNKDAH